VGFIPTAIATLAPATKKYLVLTATPRPPKVLPVDLRASAPLAPPATISYQPVVPTVQICMPLGIVQVFTVVLPTVTVPSEACMAEAPVYCTDTSGPNWKSPDLVSNLNKTFPEQLTDPDDANVPAGQAVHPPMLVTATLVLNVSIGHAMHGSTVPVLYVPAGQSAHEPTLTTEQPVLVCPAPQEAHAVQVPGPLVPEHPVTYCPTVQEVHAPHDPLLVPEHPNRYCPVLHDALPHEVHVPALVPEHPDRNWPALHDPQPVQVPALVPEHPALYCPAGQMGHGVHVPALNNPHPTMYWPAGQVAQNSHVPGMAAPSHPSLVPEHPRLYLPAVHAVQGSHVPQFSRAQSFLYWPTSQGLHGVQLGPLVDPYSPHAGVKNPALQTSQVVQLPALPSPQFIL
jgi:hypothetical protein